MQQQLQQYFVLHTYFQAYGEKIPISEITLLLKNHQIWQYFKKGCQIGRQQWRMRQRLIEENRPLPAFSTRPTWKLSSYIFHQIFSGKKGCTMGPFWTNSKYIALQCSTFYRSLHHLSHIRRCILHFWDLKITCKYVSGTSVQTNGQLLLLTYNRPTTIVIGRVESRVKFSCLKKNLDLP